MVKTASEYVEVPREEQYSGCLIGQALGDALGFVVEGYSRGECLRYVNNYLRKGRAGEIGRDPFPFGQYTDDTQLARELLRSFVERGEFDPEDYAGRIASIFAGNRIVGRGRATEEAARRLMRGVPWHEAGTPSPSAGNGSAMRAGPIGLIFYADLNRLAEAAHDQGRITHRDTRCSAGAAAIAAGVALALRERPVRIEGFLEKISELSSKYDEDFALLVLRLAKWVHMEPEEAMGPVSRAGLEPGSEAWRDGISPFVVSSVLWSLYSFLRTPGDYWETICTAISCGGDVDTTAAMAGAISGAYLGLSAIPASLAARLTDQGRWGFDDLVELSHKIGDTLGN